MSRLFLAALMAATSGFSVANAQDGDLPSFSEVVLSEQLVYLRANTRISNPSTLVYSTEEFTLVVDPGLEPTQHLLADYLGEGAVFSVTTHGHRDHAEATSALPTPRTVIAPDFLLQGETAAAGVTHWTLGGEMRLETASGDVLMGEFPETSGHTGGDLWIWFEAENVLAAGDYFFLHGFPIIDTGWGGSVDGYFTNIEWMMGRFPADTVIVPGHGEFHPTEPRTATMAEWRAWMDDVRASIALIQDWSSEGLSRDEIVERGLPERFAYLDESPRIRSEERWIDFVLENAPAAD